ncbi:hypothetical protein [Thauera chlorobenzoica]|uniref:Uncharacterized protein n=1 Tax=Thauera chlorobenzoica TaxID=96773 RepID=A0A1H5YD06_9RHOO|nr:hypothetical protein [Thauera chlorobenzoica]APR03132.1 hypothetical protein Tchl_0259 [Thauera chlorobenzoica]SEG21507.1 hypothetical protein SAMN05216242_12629 [Thauera chlorobenzoica]
MSTESDRGQKDASTLSLREAAQLLSDEGLGVHEAEILLASAIQRCELHADVMRWATEQWDGRHLPGNINGRQTRIERADFDAWRSSRAAG